MSELVVLAFNTEDGAAKMITNVERLQKMSLIKLDDAATVVRHQDGKAKVNQSNNLVGAGALLHSSWLLIREAQLAVDANLNEISFARQRVGAVIPEKAPQIGDEQVERLTRHRVRRAGYCHHQVDALQQPIDLVLVQGDAALLSGNEKILHRMSQRDTGADIHDARCTFERVRGDLQRGQANPR